MENDRKSETRKQEVVREEQSGKLKLRTTKATKLT